MTRAEEWPPLQRKETGAAAAEDAHAAARRGTARSGSSLPYLEEIQRLFGQHDIRGIVSHTDDEARDANQELGAQAYATGHHVAFACAPDLHTAAHEAAHVVQQRAGVSLRGGIGEVGDLYERHADAVADRVVAGQSAEALLTEMLQGRPIAGHLSGEEELQRRERKKDDEVQGPQDWTKADREGVASRWKGACLHNLKATDSAQYGKVVERRDFYRWFYEHTASLGYTTRWALAANLVADGAHHIADMDETTAGSLGNDVFGLAEVELQGAMREGNQVIFDNVLPKLKRLLEGGPLRGAAALRWDMQVLAEEQTLIQPMYARMSPATRQQLNRLARKQGKVAQLGAWWTKGDQVKEGPHNNGGTVPGFNQNDMQSIDDRWRYGMGLGDQFTPGGNGFNPAADAMPNVPDGYKNGSEFAKVDTRHNLHKLDAWLNPNRISRTGAGSDEEAIIQALTPFEKQQVLSDLSGDGWAYSTAFAQFGSISEPLVRRALPAESAATSEVDAFVARFKKERQRVQLRAPPPTMWGMF